MSKPEPLWYKARVKTLTTDLGRGYQTEQLVYVKHLGPQACQVYTGIGFTNRVLSVEQCKLCLEVSRDADKHPIPAPATFQQVLNYRWSLTQSI